MASLRVPRRRRVFYSFHYQPDSWRASQVRNIGVVEGNEPTSDNNWEKVKRGGSAEIKRWIDSQMEERSCTVVLVGSSTADRKWINYEIHKSLENNMGLAGIYIHGLKDKNGNTSDQGRNPFDFIEVRREKILSFNSESLSSYVKCYFPKGKNSQDKYDWIKRNISRIIEESISQRQHLTPLA